MSALAHTSEGRLVPPRHFPGGLPSVLDYSPMLLSPISMIHGGDAMLSLPAEASSASHPSRGNICLLPTGNNSPVSHVHLVSARQTGDLPLTFTVTELDSSGRYTQADWTNEPSVSISDATSGETCVLPSMSGSTSFVHSWRGDLKCHPLPDHNSPTRRSRSVSECQSVDFPSCANRSHCNPRIQGSPHIQAHRYGTCAGEGRKS